MNTDSFFTMGKAHSVCQDYALHGDGYAIVSDGCSSSPDTDFGSRFLAVGARKVDTLLRSDPALAQAVHDDEFDIGMMILNAAVEYGKDLGLSSNHLDATLLMARRVGQQINIIATGDGAIAVKDKHGVLTIKEISYAGGAPLYLNYYTDENRLKFLREQFNMTKTIKTTIIYKDGIEESEIKSDLHVNGFSFPVADYDFVAVMTDGVSSFQRQVLTSTSKTSESVKTADVVRELMAIKGIVGPFAQRRCKAFLRDCATNNVHHNDDFSIATIFTG